MVGGGCCLGCLEDGVEKRHEQIIKAKIGTDPRAYSRRGGNRWSFQNGFDWSRIGPGTKAAGVECCRGEGSGRSSRREDEGRG
ncbi:hypothetical protein COP2_029151 [Malus domestica]